MAKKEKIAEKEIKKERFTKNSNTKETRKVEKVKKVEEVKDIKKDVVSETTKEVNENVKLENSNRKSRLGLIIGWGCFLLIVIAFILSIIETNSRGKYYNTISFNEVAEIMSREETQIIYWASPTCGYCTQFKPIINAVSFDKKVVFNYLNTDSLNDDEYASMYTYFSSYDESFSSKSLGTPSLILVKNGEIINISEGAMSEKELISFLEENNIIESSEKED